jgi:hypothetical protein
MRKKWHRPMYSKMFKCVWFKANDYLITIDLHLCNWMFAKIGEKDYFFGIVRVSYQGEHYE